MGNFLHDFMASLGKWGREAVFFFFSFSEQSPCQCLRENHFHYSELCNSVYQKSHSTWIRRYQHLFFRVIVFSTISLNYICLFRKLANVTNKYKYFADSTFKPPVISLQTNKHSHHLFEYSNAEPLHVCTCRDKNLGRRLECDAFPALEHAYFQYALDSIPQSLNASPQLPLLYCIYVNLLQRDFQDYLLLLIIS